MLTQLNSPHLRNAWKTIESSIDGMGSEQMEWAPEGKWSAANLLEHLSLAFLVTVKACRMVLRQGGPNLPQPTRLQRWQAFRVIVLGFLPKRIIAPKMVRPRGQSPEDARRAAWENLVEMDRVLKQCEETFGASKGMLSHPFLGPLTVEQWRQFHLFHVRRHMKQLGRLRRHMLFVPGKTVQARSSPL